MLSEREIRRIAETLTNGNAGYAEKLYLQDIVLSTVSRETVDELVFKGGTALLKFYQLDRFSEDLDFTLNGDIELEKLVKSVVRDLENYGADVADTREEENEQTFRKRLGIEGPLFTGDRRSLSFLRIEINKKSSVSQIERLRHYPNFPDITSFDLPVLSEEEILAEKIRALLTRNQARDLYDIYRLIEKGIEIRPELVQDKLEYYGLTYSGEEVAQRASDLEKKWGTLGTLVYSEPPGFRTALKTLKKGLL